MLRASFCYRLNVQEHLLSKVQNFSHNNCLYRIDSDSDPDIFFEFHPDIILKKAKSDSVLNKFTDNGTFVSFEFKSTTRCLNIEQMDHQISVDSWFVIVISLSIVLNY